MMDEASPGVFPERAASTRRPAEGTPAGNAQGQPASRPRGQTLQRQVGLAIVLPLALLGLSIALLSGYEVHQVATRLVLERNTALATVAGAGLARELDGYLAPLQVVSGLLVQAAGRPEQEAAVLTTAAPYLARFEGGVLLLDESGNAVAASPDHTERVGKNYAFRDYFQQVQAGGRPVFSHVLQEQPSGRPVVVVAVPVETAARRRDVLTGVLFLESHPWAAELNPLTAAGGRQVYLVDAASTIIYHPMAAELGRRLSDPVLARVVAEGQPQSLRYASPFLGQAAVASYAPVPGTGWGIIMDEPWSTIAATADPWQWIIPALLALTVLLASALLLLSLRRVTRSLVALADEARDVAGGAPFRPLAAGGPAEVHALIQVFNQMVIAQEEQQATVRRYATQVLQSQEEERKRLSRELHDETVQEMVGLVQRIELCRSDVVRDPAAARRRLDELQQLAKQTVADVRRMSNDLRPLLLEDLGLAAAVQTLCDDLGRALPSTRVHCEIVGDPCRLGPERELAAFRILQEALSNARKHARSAARVDVTLYFEEWGLLATVEDDGPGFASGGFASGDVQALVRDGHLGLAGMYERARLCGAELSVTSRPATGTGIALRLPLR